MSNTQNAEVHYFYAVKTGEGKYFAGFNPEINAADFVDDPLAAKLFSNKYDIKLRPNEALVELEVSLSEENTAISEPFRPRRRQQPAKA